METITKRLKESILNGAKIRVTYDRPGLRKVIEDYSGMRLGLEYQESHLAGTLAALVKNGRLISPERGKYLLADLAEEDTFDKKLDEDGKDTEIMTIMEVEKLVNESVKRQAAYLKQITSNMNISLMNVDKNDINNVIKIKELIEYLEEFHLI